MEVEDGVAGKCDAGAIGRNGVFGTRNDVLFYVGQRRKAYSVSADTLFRGSAYFRNIISKRNGAPLLPMIIDCEESIFEALLLLMRYGEWDALPTLPADQAFRLKKEAEIYGVHYLEQQPRTPPAEKHPVTSPIGTPKPPEVLGSAPRPPSRTPSTRYHDGTRISGCTSRQLCELPEFPLDLADPTRLLLATCIDRDMAPIYACEHCRSHPEASPAATQWALSFHYRHAFCTRCGRSPTNLSPKLFAEMFIGASSEYNNQISTGMHDLSRPHEGAASPTSGSQWWVGSNSTCNLRLLSSPGSSPDACCSTRCSATRICAGHHPDTVWAANFFYSYAFCTRCGEPAHRPALLSLLLTLRYGGAITKGSSKRFSKSFRLPTSPQ
ncbi:hypothetical protein KP509_09G088300 [Ceratopteris richardii]|uniref:BTB domain-containing protein n=1 Tax=Ceratopteris richardii TaxID=49495 RepID=A0A8T2U8V5_CERRI|nr:hypothetical protein KP509_09G088300 [Ceratopteris richardii]